MTSREIAVLANPVAGRGRHRDLFPQVVRLLGAGGHTVRVLTAANGREAEDACRAAVDGGAAALVAVGGDGTVHHALQAVAGGDVPFGVVPAGTGNDFAAGTGVPDDGLKAAAAIATALRDGRDHRVDLARMTAPAGTRLDQPADRAPSAVADGRIRWFGAVLAAGFDAIVNERANQLRWPRGPRRYDLAILLELARLRPTAYTLDLDGAEHSFTGTLVAVGNCPSYGGGMRIVPGADPTDGLLDVVTAAPLGRITLTRLKPRLRNGTHVTDPRVATFRCRRVRLHAEGIVGYADGERIGPLPLEVTCVPGAIRLLR